MGDGGATNEIMVVTGPGQGHLQPCMHLCNRLTQRNFHATLVLSSTLVSSLPSSFAQNPLTSIAPIAPSSMLIPASDPLNHQSAQDLRHRLLLVAQLPLCAIVDFQMSWTSPVFWEFDIPIIALFTFGGCAAAMEWAAWKLQAGHLLPGESRPIPGLPQEMAITYSDLKRKPFGRGGRGPPKPGDRPPWVPEIEGSIALMFNSCDDLDGIFIKYMEDQMALPAWGVGPLLPDKYWQSSDADAALIRHRESSRRESNITEDEVIEWLESKPRGSVLYVAFGSEVGPTTEEYKQLAKALEESRRPFIWVIGAAQSREAEAEGLDRKVGDRGLIIQGWAPQLVILSHACTGGFLSHCGWNSTMEAIGLGVPILAWPIRGDQFYNAKLVVSHLMLGYRVADDSSRVVQKDELVSGIERLMGDEEMRQRASAIKAKLKDHGFPATSEAALDAFTAFVKNLSRN